MDTLIKELENYMPFNEQEKKDREMMIRALHTFSDIYDRSCSLCHITASIWIVNLDHTKVLMNYHNIYQSWSWCGGHADGNTNLLEVAKKELEEETGIHQYKVLSEKIFSIESLCVNPHYKKNQYISSHLHLNVTYLFQANENERLIIAKQENSGLKWILNSEISREVSEPNMIPIYQKLIEKTELFFKQKKI